jgi:NTP-dependent ternary system trypsin peptidase co-occuring protein
MATKLIQLEDGTLVEVEVSEGQAQPISGGYAQKISASFDKIQPILVRICRPLSAAWQEINQETRIEQAEVEVSLSFEGEGNLYITKAKAGANLSVKLVLKPNN